MFPIAVILCVQLKGADAAAQPGTERPATWIVVGVLAAVALAAAVTILATTVRDWLPSFYLNRSDVSYSNAVGYQSVVIALLLVATVMLFRNRKSVLDMWLLVAFSGWLIQSLLILTLHGRFTAGWYWLFFMTLFSHLVVMLALIAESNRLYARLALSTSARNREREARLMSIDAVTAAISHEVGQPLTSVSLHARAGLSRLTRPRPDVEMAIKSLRATIEAGYRTADVIKSLRAMFADQPGVTAEISLNELVRATTGLMSRELAAEKISLQLALDEALPPIVADRVQIQRVLVNLLTNAIESLGAVRGRPRRIVIRSAAVDSHDVLLEVSDNGVGISSEANGAPLRNILHDQGDRHRVGPVALSHHRRSARRASLGLAGRAVRRDLPPAAAAATCRRHANVEPYGPSDRLVPLAKVSIRPGRRLRPPQCIAPRQRTPRWRIAHP